MVELHYNPQLQDFLEFNLFHSWTSPEKKKDRVVYVLKQLLWVLIPLIIYFFYILNPINDRILIPLFVGFAITGFYMLIVLLIVKSSIRSTTLKFYTNPENKIFFEETFLIISDKAITIKQKSCTIEYLLASIIKISENKGAYYLYANTMQAIIIPKRAFDSKEKLENFKFLLKV